MTLLEFVLKEYLSIVKLLEKRYGVEKERIIVEKEEFKQLLEEYPYIGFKAKTRLYKDMNLIIHDKTSYTIPYKDKELKKAVRKVAINYKTYQTIKFFHHQKM